MKDIAKYIIREEHNFLTVMYRILDETGTDLTSIKMKSMSSKIKPFYFNGSNYELKNLGVFSKSFDVFKDDVLVATVGPKSLFCSDFKIECAGKVYVIKSKRGFKDVTILEGLTEVGKASRKTNWFKSRFGLALSEELDPVVVMVTLFIQLAVMRAAMAAS